MPQDTAPRCPEWHCRAAGDWERSALRPLSQDNRPSVFPTLDRECRRSSRVFPGGHPLRRWLRAPDSPGRRLARRSRAGVRRALHVRQHARQRLRRHHRRRGQHGRRLVSRRRPSDRLRRGSGGTALYVALERGERARHHRPPRGRPDGAGGGGPDRRRGGTRGARLRRQHRRGHRLGRRSGPGGGGGDHSRGRRSRSPSWPDGQRLYVANWGDGTISVIDLPDNSVVGDDTGGHLPGRPGPAHRDPAPLRRQLPRRHGLGHRHRHAVRAVHDPGRRDGRAAWRWTRPASVSSWRDSTTDVCRRSTPPPAP